MHGRIVTEVSKMSEATHMVVAKPTKRTIKLCAAISIVPHLVTVDWLTQSDSAGTFVSPDQYEFKGVHESAPGAPSTWCFDATLARQRARAGGCLAGHTFHVPKSMDKTKITQAEALAIVRNAGGAISDKPPRAGGAPMIVISTAEQEREWKKWVGLAGVQVLKAEHLLTCVTRQQLDVEGGSLS